MRHDTPRWLSMAFLKLDGMAATEGLYYCDEAELCPGLGDVRQGLSAPSHVYPCLVSYSPMFDHTPSTILTWVFPQTHPQGACMVPLSSWSLLPAVWKERNDETRIQQGEVSQSSLQEELQAHIQCPPPLLGLLGDAVHRASPGRSQIPSHRQSCPRLLKLSPMMTHMCTGCLIPKRLRLLPSMSYSCAFDLLKQKGECRSRVWRVR